MEIEERIKKRRNEGLLEPIMEILKRNPMMPVKVVEVRDEIYSDPELNRLADKVGNRMGELVHLSKKLPQYFGGYIKRVFKGSYIFESLQLDLNLPSSLFLEEWKKECDEMFRKKTMTAIEMIVKLVPLLDKHMAQKKDVLAIVNEAIKIKKEDAIE